MEFVGGGAPDGGEGVDGAAGDEDHAVGLEAIAFCEGGVLSYHAGGAVVGVEAEGFLIDG